MSSLAERAEAARELLRQDTTVDPHLVLAAVVWPSQIHLVATLPRRRPVTEAEAERMAELAAQGLSHRAIGEQVRRPRTTVSLVLQRREKAAVSRYAPGYARDAHSGHV